MAVTYFKRFRMERDLHSELFAPPALPADYYLVSWQKDLVEAHADVKYRSFCTEIDSSVFPCLGERDGCLRLMREISGRSRFVPEATWLMAYKPITRTRAEYCGTIQGLIDSRGLGAIQNIGITPMHRDRGLGTILLHQALVGFQQRGVDRVHLEVTADNVRAVALYERLGFHKVRTVYKASSLAIS